MADTVHKNGEMDISVQEKTFHGFLRLITWSAILAIVLLIFIGLVNG